MGEWANGRSGEGAIRRMGFYREAVIDHSPGALAGFSPGLRTAKDALNVAPEVVDQGFAG